LKQKHKKKTTPAERGRKIFMWSMLLLGVGCLSYFTYYCYEAYRTSQDFSELAELKNSDIVFNPNRFFTKTEEETPEILDEYKTLYNKNKSLIGWLKIDDTNIDFPVMQSPNEEYYLDHNFEQEYDKNGTLFINAEASIWPRSQNIIIYGHNMKSGKMFGNLSKYKEKEYYETHNLIQFDTLYEKNTYQVMYVFLSQVYNEDDITFKYYQFLDANSEEEFNSYMTDMKEMSLYETGVEAKYGESLITLSTCDHDTAEAERFVVVAKKIK